MAAKVGLTGGIGSGKSSAAKMFNKLGIEAIDSDAIALSITQPQTDEFEQIAEFIGEEVIDDSGHIDRSRLGKIVFNDESKRKTLESILHPPIRKILFQRCDESQSRYCILEVPLLIESGLHIEMDRVVVVTCDAKIRTERLQRDRKMDLNLIQKVINAQLNDKERIAVADDVLTNNATLDSLEREVKALHKKLLKMYV